MPDFDAITSALAVRFGPTIVSPPAGYEAIRLSTADLPNQMTPLPTSLVFLDSGTFAHGPGSKRDSNHAFLVRFYYSEAIDITRDMVALRKWLTILVNALQGAVQLGGLVTSARIVTWRAGTLHYAGVDYSGLEFGVTVNVNEAWTPVA
jgi:hypothetical protein